MVLLRHYISILTNTTKKNLIILLFLCFYSSNLYGLNYLENDFRDRSNSTYLNGILDIKSNSLNINIVEQKWDTLPEHKNINSAYGKLYFDIYHNFKNIKIGIFKDLNINYKVNSGFIQTLYHAKKDFTTLLNKNDIGNSIEYIDISGYLTYIQSEGFFLQKVISYSQNHFFGLKFKLFKVNEIQYLNTSGSNSSEKFDMSFDYYYSDKNFISKNNLHDDSYKGYGYIFDLEYIYEKENLYIYASILNLNSTIKLNSITHMHYDFDSQTIYKGDDGYNHYKPFGVGYYKYNIDFKYKLPKSYKATINYKLNNTVSIGNNTNIYNDITFNESYIKIKRANYSYKLGYLYENKDIKLSLYFKNITLDITNNFAKSNKIITAGYKVIF